LSNRRARYFRKWWTSAIIVLVVCCLSGCIVDQTTVSTTVTLTKIKTATVTLGLTVPPPVVDVVAVRGPLLPINPGGPEVEITLKNITDIPITMLVAIFDLNRQFVFNFEVGTTNPLSPGQTTSTKLTLIGGAFDTGTKYPVEISGVRQDGRQFHYSVQIEIMPPT
jgi:hypothetical protein